MPATLLLPPCLPSFFSLPLFLHILPLHSPSTRWTINRDKTQKSQQFLLVKTQFQTQSVYPIPKRRVDRGPAYVSTEQHYYMKSTVITTEGAPVPEGVPEEANAITKKRQRQNHAHHWHQVTRALFPGGRFPAKFGCQPIKLELYLLVHTYPANYVRVHFRHLGVYKESRVA